jgi:hypothetical protein
MVVWFEINNCSPKTFLIDVRTRALIRNFVGRRNETAGVLIYPKSAHEKEGRTRYDYQMQNGWNRSFILLLRKTKLYEIITHFTRCRIDAMRLSVFGRALFHRSRNSPVFLPSNVVKKFLQRYVRRVAHRRILLIYSREWRMIPKLRIWFEFIWIILGAVPRSHICLELKIGLIYLSTQT